MSQLPGVTQSPQDARRRESGLRPCCCVCGRPLMAPESIERGMGTWCTKKLQQAGQKRQEMDPEADVFLPIPFEKGIVLRRQGEWIIKTNVPHLVVHHSPTGFEFGYAGSGPSDLALNIVEAMLNRFGYHGDRTSCFEGSCFSLAYRLHQPFKVAFIASAPRQGSVIPYPVIKAWMLQRMPE